MTENPERWKLQPETILLVSERGLLHNGVKNQYCKCSENRSSLSLFPEKADARPLTWLKTPRTGERKRCSVLLEVFSCSQVDFFASPSDVQDSCFSAESDNVCSCRCSRAEAFKYLVRYFRCSPPSHRTGHLLPSTSLTPSFLIPAPGCRYDTLSS